MYVFLKKSGILLWDLAIEKVVEKELASIDETSEEKNVLFIGCQNSVISKL